jgi:hypothetical protein
VTAAKFWTAAKIKIRGNWAIGLGGTLFYKGMKTNPDARTEI